MGTKEERAWPFSITTLFYLMVSGFFYFKLRIDPLVVFALWTISLTVLLLTLVTFFSKISAHITGLSGLLAIIVVLALKFPSAYLIYSMIAAVLLCGLVGSARLYLGAHKPSEILGGFILGFSVCFITFYRFLF